jgi:hypothetical protein
MHILFAQGGAGGPPDGAIQAALAAIMASLLLIAIVNTVVSVIMIISGWMIFTKAGEPGWATLIPIYNLIVLLKVAGKPAWWILLYIFCCPIAIVWNILVGIGLANNFGKSTGFGVGLGLLPVIFGPMLAFSDAEFNPVNEDGRPQKRRRSRDDDDDDDDDRPRGRRRPDDDDDDDRPAPRRRRPTDDDDD